MSASQEDRRGWDLPYFKEFIQVGKDCKGEHEFALKIAHHTNGTETYGVKFYPYTLPGDDPVFAVVTDQYVLICRPSGIDKTFEVIQAIEDEDSSVGIENSSLAWSKDVVSGDPLLCVAGSSALIKIINALTGELVRTLTGHGGNINDLATSPTNPQILASASQDLTIRLWSLDIRHELQPCAVILAGEGHRETILTIAFHATGQFLLSGGEDCTINLWSVPKIPSGENAIRKPATIHYPHFSTSEVHSDIIDCVAFCGDCIISKGCNEDVIILWQITNFSTPLSNIPRVPTTHDHRPSRSAFLPTDSSLPPYTKLLQFSIPGCTSFYMRFGLFMPSPQPQSSSSLPTTTHPVLAICNSNSKVSFWDLARLIAYHEFSQSPESRRPNWLAPTRTSRKDKEKDSIARLVVTDSPSDSGATDLGSEQLSASRELWERRYGMGLRALGGVVGESKEKGRESLGGRKAVKVNGLEPHREVVIPKVTITGRQVAWSVGGEWCVVAGSPNVIAVFGRWGS